MILTFDLGTTYFKFSLFDRDGRLIKTKRIAVHAVSSRKDWCELSAQRFLATLDDGVNTLMDEEQGHRRKVDAISFATQTNSFLLLDRCGQPLTPIILWTDHRAAEIEENIQEFSSQPHFRRITGVPELNREFMIAKLCWLARHSPTVWSRTSRLNLISDYLTFLLTGGSITEAGTAGLTGLVDIERRQWSQQILDQFQIPTVWLPSIAAAGQIVGRIKSSMCDRWGLRSDCQFVVGCLDQYAGGLGLGNIAPSVLSETTGTVLSALYCTTERLASKDSPVFEGPSWQYNLFHRMIFSTVSANFLHWLREQLPSRPHFTELIELASTVEPGSLGLRIDRVSGSPEHALAPLLGKYPLPQIVRAVLEATAFELRDHVRHLQQDAPSAIVEIRSAGGASRSERWLQIKSDVLGLPVQATECDEPTSLGAAVLAEAALNRAKVSDVAAQWVRLKPALLPNPLRIAAYQY